MIYLLYGDSSYLINKEIDKIISSNNIEDINISKYELDNTNYKDIVEDASTISLFADKKAIIVSNAYIFTSAAKALDTTIFEEYIENYNPNTILIFKLNESKIDERKKTVKLIKKYGTVKLLNNGNDIKEITLSLLGEYKMDNDTLLTLIDRVGNDIYNIENEIDKIKLYKGNNYNVTKDDVINLTSENIDSNLFSLMDAITDNNKEKAITIYKELLKLNTEPIQIIISLANKYRLMYQAKSLAKSGYTELEIGKELDQNPKYMYVLLKLSKNYTTDYLLNILKDLIDLDYNIKSGNVDASLAFELFILKK